MPRKQTIPQPTIEQAVDQQQLIQTLDSLTINEKPKRTRKAKSEPAPTTLPVATTEKKARAPSKWINALKKYNEGKSGYIIPKKGSEEYEAVRALMG